MTTEDFDLEVKAAFEYLRATFPGEPVLTFAAPYNSVNAGLISYLDDYAIACRIGSNGEQAILGEKFDMYRVKSIGFSESSNFDSIQGQIEGLVFQGAWVVHFFHTVTVGEPYEGVGTKQATLDAHCKELYDTYNGRVWFASFQDVAKYAVQHKNVKVTKGEFTDNSMSFSVNSTLDSDVYNTPMSVKLYLPKATQRVQLTVNGQTEEATINTDKNGLYVIANNVPIYNSTIELSF